MDRSAQIDRAAQLSKRKYATKSLLASYKKRKRKMKKKKVLSQKLPLWSENIPTVFDFSGVHRKMFSHHLPITVAPPSNGDVAVVTRMLSKPTFSCGSGRRGRRRNRKAPIQPVKRGRGRPKKCPVVDATIPGPSNCLSGLANSVTEEGEDTSVSRRLSFSEVELLGSFVYNARRPSREGCGGTAARNIPLKLSVRLAKIDSAGKGNRNVIAEKTSIQNSHEGCWKFLSVPSVSCEFGMENMPSSEEPICQEDSQIGRMRKRRHVAANVFQNISAGGTGKRKQRRLVESQNNGDLPSGVGMASESKNSPCSTESIVAVPVVVASSEVPASTGHRPLRIAKREQSIGDGTVEVGDLGYRKLIDDRPACTTDSMPQSASEPMEGSVISPVTLKRDSACGKVKLVLSKNLCPKKFEKEVESEEPLTAEDWICQEVNFTGIRLKRENRKSSEGETDAETVARKPKKLKRSTSLLRNAKKCRPCSVALVDFVKCLNLGASFSPPGHQSLKSVSCAAPDWKHTLKSIEDLETIGPLSPIRISTCPQNTRPDSILETIDLTYPMRDDVSSQKENALASPQFLSDPGSRLFESVELNYFHGRFPVELIPSTDEHYQREISSFCASEYPAWCVGSNEGLEPQTQGHVYDSSPNETAMRLQLPKLKKIFDSVVKASKSVAAQSVAGVDGAWTGKDAGIVLGGRASSTVDGLTAQEVVFLPTTSEEKINSTSVISPGGASPPLVSEGSATLEFAVRAKRSKAELGAALHTCVHCIFSTANRVSMREHIYIHTDIIPFMCGLCGALFGTQSSANLHCKRDHPGKDCQIIKDSTINAEDHYTTEYAAKIADCKESKIDAEESKIDVEKSKIDTEKSKIDAEKSKINTDKSKIDTEKSKINAQKSTINAEESKIDAEKSKIDASTISKALSCHDPDVSNLVAVECFTSENSDVRSLPFKNCCQNTKTIESVEVGHVFKDLTKGKNLKPLILNDCQTILSNDSQKSRNNAIDLNDCTSKDKIYQVQPKTNPVLRVCVEKCSVDDTISENSRPNRSSLKGSTARNPAARRPGPRCRTRKDLITSASGGLPVHNSPRSQNRKVCKLAGYSEQSFVDDGGHSGLPSSTSIQSTALPLSPVGEISVVTCRTASDASELSRRLLSPKSSTLDNEQRRRTTSSRRYSCLHCDYSTSEIADIENHVFVMHPRMKRLVCPICECYFCKWKPTMLSHFSTLHPKVKPVLVYEPSYLQKEDADLAENKRGKHSLALPHGLQSRKKSPKRSQVPKSQSVSNAMSLRRSGRQSLTPKASGSPRSASKASVFLSGPALGVNSTECQLKVPETQPMQWTSDTANENINSSLLGASEELKKVKTFKEELVDNGGTSGNPNGGTTGDPNGGTSANPSSGTSADPEEPISSGYIKTDPGFLQSQQPMPVFGKLEEPPSGSSALSSSEQVVGDIPFYRTSKSTERSSVPRHLSEETPTLDLDNLVSIKNSKTARDTTLVLNIPNDSGESVGDVLSDKTDKDTRKLTEDIPLCDAESCGVSLSSAHHESSSPSCTITSDRSHGKIIDSCDSERIFAETGAENDDFGTILSNVTSDYPHDSRVNSSVVDPETVAKDMSACKDMDPSRIISSSTSRKPTDEVCTNINVSLASDVEIDCSAEDGGKAFPSGQMECRENSGLVERSTYSPRCVFAIGCIEFSHDSSSTEIPVSGDAGKKAALCSNISASDVSSVFRETEEKTLIVGDGCKSSGEEGKGTYSGAVGRVTDGNDDGKGSVESVEVIRATVVDETDTSDDAECKTMDEVAAISKNDSYDQNVEVSAAEQDDRNSEVNKTELLCAAEDSVRTARSENDLDATRTADSRLNCAVKDTVSILWPDNDSNATQTVDSGPDCVVNDSASIVRSEYDSNATQTVDSKPDVVANDSASIVTCENDSNTTQTVYSRPDCVFKDSASCVRSENDSSASQTLTSGFETGPEEYNSNVSSGSDIFVMSSSVANVCKEFCDQYSHETDEKSMHADGESVLNDNRVDGKCALEVDVVGTEDETASLHVASINKAFEADEIQSSTADVFGTEIVNVFDTEIESVMVEDGTKTVELTGVCDEQESDSCGFEKNVQAESTSNSVIDYPAETLVAISPDSIPRESCVAKEAGSVTGTAELEGGTKTFELTGVCDEQESDSCRFEENVEAESICKPVIQDPAETLPAVSPDSILRVSCVAEETDSVAGTVESSTEFSCHLEMLETPRPVPDVTTNETEELSIGGSDSCIQGNEKLLTEDLLKDRQSPEDMCEKVTAEGLDAAIEDGEVSVIAGQSDVSSAILDASHMAPDDSDVAIGYTVMDSKEALDSVIASECNDEDIGTVAVDSEKASDIVNASECNDEDIGTVAVDSEKASDSVTAGEFDDETVNTTALDLEKAADSINASECNDEDIDTATVDLEKASDSVDASECNDEDVSSMAVDSELASGSVIASEFNYEAVNTTAIDLEKSSDSVDASECNDEAVNTATVDLEKASDSVDSSECNDEAVNTTALNLEKASDSVIASECNDEAVNITAVDLEKASDSVIASECNVEAVDTTAVNLEKASDSVIASQCDDEAPNSDVVDSEKASDSVIASECNDEAVNTAAVELEKISDSVIVSECNDEAPNSGFVDSEKVFDIANAFEGEDGSVAVDSEMASDSVIARECNDEAVNTTASVDLEKVSDSVNASEGDDDNIASECNDEAVNTTAVDLEKASDSVIASECNDEAVDTTAVDLEKASDSVIASECNDEAFDTVVVDLEKVSDSVNASECNDDNIDIVAVDSEKALDSVTANECDDEDIGAVVVDSEKALDSVTANECDDEDIGTVVVDIEKALDSATASECNDDVDTTAVDLEKDSDSVTASECDDEAIGGMAVDSEKASDSVNAGEGNDDGRVAVDSEKSSDRVGASECHDEDLGIMAIEFEKAGNSMITNTCGDEAPYSGIDDTEKASGVNSSIASVSDDDAIGNVDAFLGKTSDSCTACDYEDGAIHSVVVDTEKAVCNIAASADEAIDLSAAGSEKVLDSIATSAFHEEAFDSVVVDFEKASDSVIAVECDMGAVGSPEVVGSQKFSDATDMSETSSQLVDGFQFDHAMHTGESSEGFPASTHVLTDVMDRDQESSNVLIDQSDCSSESEHDDLEQSEFVVDATGTSETSSQFFSDVDSCIEQNAQQGLPASTESVQCKEAFDSAQDSGQSSQVAATTALTVNSGGENVQEYSSESSDHNKAFDSVQDSEQSSQVVATPAVTVPTDISVGENVQEYSSGSLDNNEAFDGVKNSVHASLATMPAVISSRPNAQQESLVIFDLTRHNDAVDTVQESSVLSDLTQRCDAVDTVQDSGHCSHLVTTAPAPVPKVLAEPESTSSTTSQDLSEESRREHIRTDEAASCSVRSEDCMCLEVSSTSDDPAAGLPEVPTLGVVPANEGTVPTSDSATDEELDVETYTEEEPEKTCVDKESEEPCGRKETMPKESVCRYCSFSCASDEKMIQHMQQVHKMESTNSTQQNQYSTVQGTDVELPGSRVATKSTDEGYDLRVGNVIVIEPNNNLDRVERKRRRSLLTDDSDNPEPVKHPCRVAVPTDEDEDDVIFVREEKRPLAVSHSSRSNSTRSSDAGLTKPDAAVPCSIFRMSPAVSSVGTESVTRRHPGFKAPEKDVRRGLREQDIVLQEQSGRRSNDSEMSCGIPAVDALHRLGDRLEPFLADSCSNRSVDTTKSSQWPSNPVNYAFVTRAICRPIMSTMTLDPASSQHQANATLSMVGRPTADSGYRGNANSRAGPPNVVVTPATDTCGRNPHRPTATRVAGPPPLMHISELQSQSNLGTGSRFYPDDHISRNPATGSRPIDSRADFGSRPLVNDWSNFPARQPAHTARAPADVQDFSRPLSNNRGDTTRTPGDVQGDYPARPLAHSGSLFSRTLDDNRANHATRHVTDNSLESNRSDNITKHPADNRGKLSTRPPSGNRTVTRHLAENLGEFAIGSLVDNPADLVARRLSDGRDFSPSVDNHGNNAMRQLGDNRGDFTAGRPMVPPPAHSKIPVRQLPMHGSSYLPTSIQPCPNIDGGRNPYDWYSASPMHTRTYPAHLQVSKSGGIFQGTVRSEKPPPAHLPQRSQAHITSNIPHAHSYQRPSHGAFEPPRVRNLEAAASATNSCLLCSFQASDRWSLYNHILTHSLPDHGN